MFSYKVFGTNYIMVVYISSLHCWCVDWKWVTSILLSFTTHVHTRTHHFHIRTLAALFVSLRSVIKCSIFLMFYNKKTQHIHAVIDRLLHASTHSLCCDTSISRILSFIFAGPSDKTEAARGGRECCSVKYLKPTKQKKKSHHLFALICN